MAMGKTRGDYVHVYTCKKETEKETKTDGKRRGDTGQGDKEWIWMKENVFLVSTTNSGISKSNMH